ncbi:MAG: hypothetical protein GY927_18935 [bacterium]|nr:hypothetical protein [bacterium]
MREKLYPWMPPNSFVQPIIYYRLSETIRNTLVWKDTNSCSDKLDWSEDLMVRTCAELTITQTESDQWLVYNWDSHHYMEGNDKILQILDQWRSQKTVRQGLLLLTQEDPDLVYEDILILFKKMYLHGHFTKLDHHPNKNMSTDRILNSLSV